MATDLERLVVSLEANIKRYERELARARPVADRAIKDVEASLSRGTSKIEGMMSRVGSSIRGAMGGALVLGGIGTFLKLVDTYTKVQNSLKVTGLQGEKLTGTFEQIFAIAQKQGAPLETLAGLYSKASQNQKELNASSADLITFTNSVATALRAGGVGAVQADQALMQLGQALGSGKVQWEDLESVVDSAPTILQAAAAGIKEAGGSVGQLIQLVKDGKVSSEALFRAINAGLPAVQALAARTDETASQGLARLNNALVRLSGQLAESANATQIAVDALGSVTNAVDTLTGKIPGAVKALSEYFQELSKAPYFQSLVQSIAATEGGDTPAEAAAPGVGRTKAPNGGTVPSYVAGIDRLRDAMKARGEILDAAAKKDKKAADAADNRVSRVFDADTKALAPKTISLSDYKVPGEKEKKGKGGGGGSKEKENDLQRETAAIQKRTGALENELTTVGKSAGAAAEAEAKFKLLEAAKKANITVGPALMADIEKTAAAFGVATEKLEQAEAANRKFEAASRQAGATLSDAFSDAIVNGEKLTDVMNRLVKSLATRGIDSIFETLFSKGGAGNTFLGGLIKGEGISLNPTGRASGGQVKAGVGYDVGESGRERFVPTSPGRIISNRKLTGGRPAIRMGDINISAPGADPAALMGLRAYVDQARAEDRRLIGQSLANWRENNP